MILAARLARNFAMAAFLISLIPTQNLSLNFPLGCSCVASEFAEMQERRADEVLVLDGEAIWSRAIQETFNRLDKAVGSLLDGSQPACFPICARCWFSMGKHDGREPSNRLPTAAMRRLEVSCVALDHIASPSRTSTSSARGSCISANSDATHEQPRGKFKLKFCVGINGIRKCCHGKI